MRLFLAPVLAATLLAACGGDAHDSATFATATDEQLLRVIDVARFEDAEDMLEISELFGRNEPGCPSVSTTGLVTTITGDCTSESGWTIAGRVVITNFGFDSVPARDPAQPSTIEAFGLRATRDDRLQTLDGKVELVLHGTSEGSPFDLLAAIDVTNTNLPAHTEGAIRCNDSEGCRYDGAWIGVDTVGEAEVADGLFDDDTGSLITLHGEETLAISLERDDQGCFPVTIDGAARTVCEPAFKRTTARWSSILR